MAAPISDSPEHQITKSLMSLQKLNPENRLKASIAIKHTGAIKFGDRDRRIIVRFLNEEFINEMKRLPDNAEESDIDPKLLGRLLEQIEKGDVYYKFKIGQNLEQIVVTREEHRKTVMAQRQFKQAAKQSEQQAKGEPPATSQTPAAAVASPGAATAAAQGTPQTPNITVLNSQAVQAITQVAKQIALTLSTSQTAPTVEQQAPVDATKEATKPRTAVTAAQTQAAPTAADTKKEALPTKTKSAEVIVSESSKRETERTQNEEKQIEEEREVQKKQKLDLKKTITQETETARQENRLKPQKKEGVQVGPTDQEGDRESVRTENTKPTDTS